MPGVLAQATHPALASKAGSTDPVKAEDRTVPALFISDIHFDPFQDPAKVQELVAAPATRWRSILLAPASSNQKEAFAALQQTCHARGVDTPFALLDSSLKAMRSKQPDAKFMTVSGDLIAHAFFCRFATLVPGSTPGDYQTFVLKTMNFVMGELRASIPGMPVYVALGNNDTECDDYQLDAGSEFLAQAGRIVAEALPQSQRQQVLKEFQDSLAVIVIRCPTIIDEGRLGLLAILFEFIDEGRKVWVVGDGSNRYQFIYAQDLATACVLAMDYGKSGLFHVGADNVPTLREVYQAVIDAAGTGARIAQLPRRPTIAAMKLAHTLGVSPLGPYHYRMIAEDFVFDTTRIRDELGWRPTVTNQQMMLKAYQYYAARRKEIDARAGEVSAHSRPAAMGVIRLLKWLS